MEQGMKKQGAVDFRQSLRALGEMMAEFQQKLDALHKQMQDFLTILNRNDWQRHIQLDAPRFHGDDDPYAWAFRINHYFSFHNTAEAQRLQIVCLYLDGKALCWFRWLETSGLLTTWDDFLQQVKLRFGSSRFEDHMGNLSKLVQKGSVEEFMSEFERAAVKVEGVLPEALQISLYVSGLKPYIRREVQVRRQTTVEEAFALARLFEDKYLE